MAVTVELLAPPRPGIYEAVKMEEYLRWDAAGNSDLMNMKRSPAYAAWARTQYTPNGPSQAFGIALHARLLEPAQYEQIVGVLPDGLNLRTKAGRAERDALRETREVVLTVEESIEVEAAARAVLRHKAASALMLAPGPTERSVVVEDDVTGCPIKIRPDKLIPTKGIVIDLKTTRMVSERRFVSQAFDLGYDRKMSLYRHAMNQLARYGPSPEYKTAVLVVVQNTRPYEPLVVAFKERVLTAAGVSWRRDLNRFAECREAGEWPGFTEDVEILDFKDWMIDARENDAEEMTWSP